MSGTLSSLNPDVEPAEPYVDFTFSSDGVENNRHYVLFRDGATSVPIKFKIIDDNVPELNEIFLVNLTSVVLERKSPEAINFIPPAIGEHLSGGDICNLMCLVKIWVANTGLRFEIFGATF